MEKMNISFSSQAIELSERKNYLEVLNRVCYYGEPNANNVRLPYDEGTLEKAQTLENMPVYAKYTIDSKGKPTFKGHEVSVDANGELVFGTTPIGVHTSVYIQDDTVELADKRIATLPCLFAKQRIWKRNKNVVAAVKRLYEENNLHNSWEIASFEYVYKDGIKDLIDYVFEGNTYLGTEKPAYGEAAKVLDVSARESELLVAEALAKDVLEASENPSGSEVEQMEEEKIEQQEEQVTPGTNVSTEEAEQSEEESSQSDQEQEPNKDEQSEEESSDEKQETSALTDWDLRKALDEAIMKILDRWIDFLWVFPSEQVVWCKPWDNNETDLVMFTFTVEGDVVTLSEPQEVKLTVSPREMNISISAKDATIVSLNSQIQELSATVASLSPFKEAFEKSEADRLKAEHDAAEATLLQYVEDSGMFTKDEIESKEISSLISELKTSEIDALIAKRVVAKNAKTRKTETATQKQSPKPKADINVGDVVVDKVSILKKYIHET